MTNALTQKVQHQAYKLVVWQLIGILILALAGLIIKGPISGFSILMGGLAYGLPNLIFVWRVFRYTRADEMVKFMAAFFIGEMLKLFISAILFLLIVKYLPVSLLSVLVGFIGAIISFWIACLWHFSKKAKH